MHKILQIPELLDEILLRSSRHTKTVAARVCKLWFAHAIPIIWNTVGINNALMLLSPFVVNLGEESDDILAPRSWDRFSLCSKHIRHLNCYQIDFTALRQAVFWRPAEEPLFSKLTTIYWAGEEDHIEYLIPLLTSTLRGLSIEIFYISNSDLIDVLCKTISKRSPYLHCLEVGFELADEHPIVIARSLVELPSLLPMLVSFTYPIHSMTTESFITLSQHPGLRHLALVPTGLLFSNMEDWEFSKREIPEKAHEHFPFCSLEAMAIWGDETMEVLDGEQVNEPFTMAKIFRHGTQLFQLVDLTCSPRSDQITDIMESVHVVCPNLQKIYIDVKYVLPWQAIQPLLKCRALVDLQLEAAINMELEDLVTIATNRSTWKVIRLRNTIHFSYRALVLLVQNCPDLTALGICLSNETGIPDINLLSPDIEWSSLTTLDVHKSSITGTSQIFEVVTFLSRICGRPITIEYHSEAELWKDIEGMVNSIITTRLENFKLKLRNSSITI